MYSLFLLITISDFIILCFFKQKTAYEMRISDCSSDVCASDLPRSATGEVIVSFCLTEPGSGSDSAALITSAVRDGDDYLLSGTKRFITNAPLAGLFLVMARTSRERLPKNAHISAFLVPADAEGIEVGKKIGRASGRERG